MTEEVKPDYDVEWDDPLPHAHSPTKFFLSRMKQGRTKAVAIFVHGREDAISDMVGVFLPTLYKRYGGNEGQIHDDNEDEDSHACQVAIVGIEARDYYWYPASHATSTPHELKHNEPYQYSSLEKIRQTILLACEETRLPPEKIVLVGFSQGGNLANTYLKASLQEIITRDSNLIPLPGHIVALAGSLFKVMPAFPRRGYASVEHEEECKGQESETAKGLLALPRPSKVIVRMLCGTKDRFFSQDEIKEAAANLAKVGQLAKDAIEVQISVGFEPNAPHMITSRMMAATVEAIDAILES
jgi:hypothetical protein